MPVDRVAIIFDDQTRPETTGVYCRRALEQLVDVQHLRPSELSKLGPGEFDLYVNVDDGLQYDWPDHLYPSCFWAIDSHLDFERCLQRSRAFDFVCAAQRDGADRLRRAGVSNCRWLPLACDPDVHRPHEVENRFDVSFVGNALPGERSALLHLLSREFPRHFIGQAYFDEMAQIYSGSQIVFNRSVRNDINMRVFEALACRSLLVTNDLTGNGQAELFQDGVHYATYCDAEELVDKIRFYLANDKAREKIAATGHDEAVAKHTYRHRMQEMLHLVAEQTNGKATRATQQQLAFTSSADTPDGLRRVPPDSGAIRDRSYFHWTRPELLPLVPETATRILDVGCGAGALSATIKARQQSTIVGIEGDEVAAELARDSLDEVLIGDVETAGFDFAEDSFDCVICADVLEHLRDPAGLLRRIRTWLAPNGLVVVSIPNVRHYSVIAGLLDGNWTYEAAGILDQTHRQFFTRRDFERLLIATGFSVEDVACVPGPGYAEWTEAGSPGTVCVNRLAITQLPTSQAEEFYAYQFLFSARPNLTCSSSTRSLSARTFTNTTQGDDQVGHRPNCATRNASDTFNLLYVAQFDRPSTLASYVTAALRRAGHQVTPRHEFSVASPDALVDELHSGGFDCMLFSKGRIGPRAYARVDLEEDGGDEICKALRSAKVPCYMWYVDRAYQYSFEPRREAWMRKVAPLCRLAFVTDGGLAKTTWADWHLLREGIARETVETVDVSEEERLPVGFIGQIYGDRHEELWPIEAEFDLSRIDNAFGTSLSREIRRHKIVIGPKFPSADGYWSSRIYIVLGHGGFFLAPEVVGMREEGFIPGVHYAPLGEDVIADIEYWLARPKEREAIARAGQEFVLENCTYDHRTQQLADAIARTL